MKTLIRYDAACKAIASAKRVDEVKGIRDKAEAIRVYGRQANNKKLEVDAAEIRFRAERRLGEMLAQSERAKGKAGPGRGKAVASAGPAFSNTPTLTDLGIDKKLSARSQKLAAIPEAKFEATLGEWREDVSKANEKVTTNLLKAGDKASRRAEREADLGAHQTALPDKKYGVILADPEWRFEPYSRETGMDRAAANHYPTSSTEIIAARPVGDMRERLGDGPVKLEAEAHIAVAIKQ